MDSNDKRFSKIGVDPKFKRVPKDERKVKIDKRFQSIFNDKRFKVKYTIDKRGRPLHGSTSEDFKKFYHISDDEDENDDTNSEHDSNDDVNQESDDVQTSVDEDNDGKRNKIKKNIEDRLKDKTIDYARGDGELMSDSSSDDDTSSDEEKEEDVEHNWGELDKDAVDVSEATSRLALCNMDWDRIQAADLMILFNSFSPTDGFIKSITIYPSEFGMKRMQEEEIKGPPELISSNPKAIGSSDESDQEEEDGRKYHMEKLRKYQLARLKYYYAIVVCDSPETANKIYVECDGLEYESSATRLDLRFVPDDTEFDQEPKEVCDKLPDLTKYKPHLFTTTALQQAKVNLTWDETDPRRNELVNKLKTNPKSEIDDCDLQKYVAFSSEDENSECENKSSDNEEENSVEVGSKKNPIDKYKELLQNIQEQEEEKANKDTELEISWGIGLQEKIKKSVDEKSKKNLTPFQKMMEKKKERMKEKQKLKKELNEKKDDEETDSENESKRHAELELLLMDEELDVKQHFNMKKIQEEETKSSKKKKKKKNENEKSNNDTFAVDVKDDRFSALYTSHLFNIDPADPKFKRTKGMEAIISEKASRRQQYDTEKVDLPPKKKLKQSSSISNPELSYLVKSIKNKTKKAY